MLESKKGLLYTVFSYVIWGNLPIFWKLLAHVPASLALFHRIFWSVLFLSVLLIMLNKRQAFQTVWAQLKCDRNTRLYVVAAAMLISLNWFAYIWAIANDRMVDASLGAYLTPLISVMFGVLFLGERLRERQRWSVFVLSMSVLWLVFFSGTIPLVALFLAITFAFYGLVKKQIQLDALVSLWLETLLVSPIALMGVLYTTVLPYEWPTWGLLLLAGPLTALPLLLYGMGVQRIPLSLVGFIQYISPTITLSLGVLWFGEHVSPEKWIGFVGVWLAIGIYVYDAIQTATQIQKTTMNGAQ
ncbi:MAG: EamA family transporter RarD [Bacilli bacterium]